MKIDLKLLLIVFFSLLFMCGAAYTDQPTTPDPAIVNQAQPQDISMPGALSTVSSSIEKHGLSNILQAVFILCFIGSQVALIKQIPKQLEGTTKSIDELGNSIKALQNAAIQDRIAERDSLTKMLANERDSHQQVMLSFIEEFRDFKELLRSIINK